MASCDRKRWIGEAASPPASSLDRILECLGLTVVPASLGDLQGRLLIPESRIEINRHLPRLVDARSNPWAVSNWIIAHELGHHQLHRWELARGITRPDQEREADWYASELLLPVEQVHGSGVWREIIRLHRDGTLTSEHRRRLTYSLAQAFYVSPTAAQVRISELLAKEKMGVDHVRLSLESFIRSLGWDSVTSEELHEYLTRDWDGRGLPADRLAAFEAVEREWRTIEEAQIPEPEDQDLFFSAAEALELMRGRTIVALDFWRRCRGDRPVQWRQRNRPPAAQRPLDVTDVPF